MEPSSLDAADERSAEVRERKSRLKRRADTETPMLAMSSPFIARSGAAIQHTPSAYSSMSKASLLRRTASRLWRR
jgi:hypothetical protein